MRIGRPRVTRRIQPDRWLGPGSAGVKVVSVCAMAEVVSFVGVEAKSLLTASSDSVHKMWSRQSPSKVIFLRDVVAPISVCISAVVE